MRYAVRDFIKVHGKNWAIFPDKVAIHINDTHPAIAIPELMRIFMDDYELSWAQAEDLCRRTFAYTNHTVMAEALEKWPEDLIKRQLPRIYQILEEMNKRLCSQLWKFYPGQWERIGHMAILAYGQAHMANLAVAWSHCVNGVSKIHTDILKKSTFRDYYVMKPGKFISITNGITHRRWLIQCNPDLASLIDEAIGDAWRKEPQRLKELTPFADDASFRERFGKIKRDKIGRNKTQRPEESWQIIENAHPAIVERELFEKIQRINQEKLAKRERYGACNEVTVDHRSLFRGKVVCGECGHLLTAAKGCARPGAKSGSRVFFDCSTYKKSNHTQCSSHYIRQETLFHAIQHTLDQQVRIAVDFGKMLADVQKMPTIKAAKSAQTKKQVSLRVKRQNIENKLEQLLHDLTTGLITRDEYEYIKRRYNEQYAQIQSEEIALRETMKVAERQLRSAEQWLAEVKRYQKIPVIDRPMIDLLIREIKVFQDRSVKIELNYADPCQPLYAYMDLYTEERHAV